MDISISIWNDTLDSLFAAPVRAPPTHDGRNSLLNEDSLQLYFRCSDMSKVIMLAYFCARVYSMKTMVNPLREVTMEYLKIIIWSLLLHMSTLSERWELSSVWGETYLSKCCEAWKWESIRAFIRYLSQNKWGVTPR